MSGPYVIRGSVSLPEAELMWRFSRSSGPGGQHVNTSDSQVELRFDLAATEALPQVWKERALERLAGRLVDGVVARTGVRAPLPVAQPRDGGRPARLAAGRGERAAAQAAPQDSGSRAGSTSAGCGEEAARATRSAAAPGPRLGQLEARTPPGAI